MPLSESMKQVLQFSGKIGIEVTIITNQEVTFYPRNNKDRQDIYWINVNKVDIKKADT